MSFLLAFLAFAALIVLHEAGHFAAAKAVGMRVEKFSLFFGPMLVKKQIGETVYGIGPIPLGGFVKITGMSEVELDGVEFVSDDEAEDVKRRAYYNQPVWKRIVVIGAGPAVNLVIAIILAWFLFLGQNHYVANKQGNPIPTTKVGALLANSAASGKLHLNDRIVSIDGVKGDPAVLREQIIKHRCKHDATVNGCRAVTPLTMVVERHGRLLKLHITPRYSRQTKSMLVGFVFLDRTASNGPLYSAGQAVSRLWYVTKVTVSHIVQIFKPKYRRQLQGVAGAYYETAVAINHSTSEGLDIIALISLSLGIINLFPFLPLDGGHIFWALAEKVRGKRISIKVIERASMVGIALILILFAVGMSNSIHMFSAGKP